MTTYTSYTSAQIAALSLAEAAAMTTANIASLTTAQLPAVADGLSQEQFFAVMGHKSFLDMPLMYAMYVAYQISWEVYKAAQLPMLSAAQIAALAPAAIGGLTITQLYRFSAAQLSALTTAQIAELPKSQTSTLTTAQINMLSAAARLGLVDVDVTGYTAAQLQALSNTQVSRITTTSLASLAPGLLAVLSAAQVQYLSASQIAVLSSAQVMAMTAAQLGALSATQVAALKISVVQGLGQTQISVMSSVALLGLSGAQTAALPTSAVSGLTATTLAGFTVASKPTVREGLADIFAFAAAAGMSMDLGALSNVVAPAYALYKASWVDYNAAQLSWMSAAQIAALAPSAISGLSIAKLFRLGPAQLLSLTSNQLAELPKSQTQQITIDQKNMLSVAALAGLADVYVTAYSAAELMALSNNQVSRISTASLANLAPSLLAVLSTTQLQYLSASQIAVLTSTQVATMTDAQLGSLSATQISSLSISVVQGLGSLQISAMSATALTGLTATQIKMLSISALSKLSAVTLVGYSIASKPEFAEGLDAGAFWIAAKIDPTLNANVAYAAYGAYRTSWAIYNAAQLSNLSAVQVSALAPAALGGLTVSQLLRFSNEQFALVTVAQEAALAALRLPNGDVVTVDGLVMPRINTSTSTYSIVASWSTRQLKLLSTAQWSAMTPEQAGAVNPTALAGFTTTEVFTRIPEVQLKGLRTAHYMAWSETTRNALTTAQLTSLGGNFLKEMTTANLMGMTTAQRQGLSPSQVQSLPTNAISGLTSTNLNQVIADGFFAKFSGLQARQLDSVALAAVNSASFTAIANANFQGLLRSHIVVLPASVWIQATGAALSAMQVLSFQAITAAQLGQITVNAIGALSAQRWSELSPEQVGFLSAAQLAAKSSLKGLRTEGLTPVQIASISATKIAALDIADLAKLTISAIGSLTREHIQALSAEKFRAFSIAQIKAITSQAIEGLTISQLMRFSDEQLQAMTETQRVALATHNFPDSSVGVTVDGLILTRTDTSTCSIAIISSWTASLLKLLTHVQWVAMTPERVGAINPAALAGLTTTEIFTKIPEAQIKGLRTAHYMAWSERTRNALTSAQLSSLGENFLVEMTTQNLMGLTSAQRQGLSASQVQSLPVNAVSGLSSAYLNQLITDGLFTKFTGPQARQLNPDALRGVSDASFTAIVNANFQGLLRSHIAVLPSAVWARASGAALSAMQILSFQAITAAQLGQITVNAISALSAQRWSEFSPEQVGFLSAAQLAAKSSLKGLRVEGLTSVQIASISATKIAALDIADLAKLTISAIGSLTREHIQALSAEKFRAFSIAQIYAINANVLQSISEAQKNALNAAQRGTLFKRGIDVSQAEDNASKGLTLARLMYASNLILNDGGEPRNTVGNGAWDQLVKTVEDGTDGTSISLFKHIDTGNVIWGGEDYAEADYFTVADVLINGKPSDINWKSTYTPVWDNPSKPTSYGRYKNTGNVINWVDDDIASLFNLSDSYGRNHLLVNLRSYSIQNIRDHVQGGLATYITADNMYCLTARNLNGLTDEEFVSLLNINQYWGQWSQTGGVHAGGAVACDNPFGSGVLNDLTAAKLGLYLNKLQEQYTVNGRSEGLFSDGVWADISEQKKIDLGMVNTYLTRLTAAQLQSISNDLINTISGDALKTLADTRIDLLKSFTPAQISVLPKPAINALAEKVVNFNADQFLAFTGIQIMGIESPAAWRAVVADYKDIARSYIDNTALYLSGGAISTLTAEQIANLPNQVVQNLKEADLKLFKSPQLMALTAAQVSLMTREQVGWLGENLMQLDPKVINILTPSQLADFSQEQIKNWPYKPISLMTDAEIANVSVAVLLTYRDTSLALLTNQQLSGLTKEQALNLNPSQYLSLSTEQQQLLKAVPVVFLNNTELNALSIADIKKIDVSRFEIFTAKQLASLSLFQIGALTSAQISHITPWTMGALQAVTFAKFSDDQVKSLSISQLAQVGPSLATTLSTKWAKLLDEAVKAQLSSPTTPAARIAKELRSVYTISNAARNQISHRDMRSHDLQLGYLGAYSPSKGDTNVEKTQKLIAIFLAQQSYLDEQQKSTYRRLQLQRGKGASSVLSLGATISAFGLAGSSGGRDDKENTVTGTLAGLAYLSSLLQTPVTEIVSYKLKLDELKGVVVEYQHKKAIHTELVKWEREEGILLTGEHIESVESVEAGRKIDANLAEANNALEAHRETGRSKWQIQNWFSDLSEDQLKALKSPLPTIAVGTEGLTVETGWESRRERHARDEKAVDFKRQAGVIFCIADVFGIANSLWQVSLNIKKKDNVGIAIGLVDTIGNAMMLGGDSIDFFRAPSTKAAMENQRWNGRGMILVQLAASAASVYSSAKYLQENPNNGRAKGALAMDVIVQTAVLLATIIFMANPYTLLIGLFMAVAVPNTAAIRQVQELKDQQTSFNNHGRSVWANVIFASLIKIAEMNVNAITAMASFGYADAEMTSLRKKMNAGDMQRLLGEDYKDFLETEQTPENSAPNSPNVYQRTIRTISRDIQGSLETTNTTPGIVEKIAGFINITRQSADQLTYYASLRSTVLQYATRLDVRKAKSDGTIDFDAVAVGLNTDDINVTITDIADTAKDSVIIVNVSSEKGLDEGKYIDITNKTINNKVNFNLATSHVRFVGSLTGKAILTVVEGMANSSTVTSLSGLDVVNFSGAALAKDGTINNPESITLWNSINLDNFINVAAVIAGATTMHNIVTGSKEKQSYCFNNGRDQVTMTGGIGTAVVGGRETALTMAGGNNHASVRLGGRVEGMAWAADAKLGLYDGGAAVAATGSTSGSDYRPGTNTISFVEAYAKLKFDIVEPVTSEGNGTYATYSKVTTVGLDVQDIGAFKNFQTVIGSNFGDIINVDGTKTLQNLVLGMGQNFVNINNVKAPPGKSSSGASWLTINALLSLSNAANDITIIGSDVGFEGSRLSNNLIEVSEGSKFVGELRGRDHIFTDTNEVNFVSAVYAEGEHLLDIHGGYADVTMFSGSSGDAVINVDENATVEIKTMLRLSGNQLTQMVSRDASGLHFSLAQANGDAQEVDYSFGDETSDLARNTSTLVNLFKDDSKPITVTVAALNDAINALSGAANYGATSSTYKFETLYNKAVLMHPSA